MTLTAPEKFSTQHGALRPRAVYVADLATTYAFWLVSTGGTKRLFVQAHGDDEPHALFFDTIVDYDVADTGDGRVVIFYTNGEWCKTAVYDPGAETVTEPVVFDRGQAPATFEGGVYVYERDGIVRMRTGVGEGGLQPVPGQRVVAIAGDDTGPFRFLYLGAHGLDSSLALALTTDASVSFLHHLDDYPTANAYIDHSGNTKNLVIGSGVVPAPGHGLVFDLSPQATISAWSGAGDDVTFEAIFIPIGGGGRSYLLTGALFAGFDGDGRAWWGYDDGTYIHTHIQTGRQTLIPGVVNSLAFAHTWGVKSSTILVLNGLLVPSRWYSTIPYDPVLNVDEALAGTTDPGFTTLTSTIAMGPGDVLKATRLSRIFKSATTLRDVVRGRS